MTQAFKRDDGSDITVDYELEEAGESNFDSPGHICDGGGSGPLWTITGAWNAAGEEITLTDAERERMEAWLAEHVEYDPGEDYIPEDNL